MRLFSGKIPTIAGEIVERLVADKDIEAPAPAEVTADLESVLKEYLRQERRVLDEAKSRMESRGMSYGELGKMKQQVARENKIQIGDDMLPYLMEQILEILFHSSNVEEIFSDDPVLRKKITTILRKHMDVEQELDREVRDKIKNLDEGTAAFETEYARMLEQMKRNKRLT
jgi:uncharacterized protein